MSTIWERYKNLPGRQRVLLGVMGCLGASVGLWLENNTETAPVGWTAKTADASGRDAARLGSSNRGASRSDT